MADPYSQKGTSHPDSLKYRMGKSSVTSAATALSAGVGAMVIDAYMDSGRGGRPIPEDVYGIMEHSASPCWRDELIPNAWEPNFHVGWGRLNAGLAVYDAMNADIDHHTGNSSWGQEEIGWFEWDCPAGDECNFPGQKVIAVAWRCMRLVAMPSGNRTGCWGHHRSPTSGTIPLLVDGLQAADVQEALSYDWCDPMQYHRSAALCTLQTFVYYLFHPFDPNKSGKEGCPYEQVWVPVGLSDVTFSYTTLSSDRFLSSVDGSYSGHHGAHLPRPALEAFPRPANPEINIRYSIPVRGEVSMCIYDVNGRLVRRLVAEDMEPGLYFATWDGRNETGAVAASGIYFCRLDVAGQHTVEKIVLLR